MPVYDRSYRRWDGELKRRALRFIPITAMGVKSALGMKGGWFFTILLRTFMLVSVIPTLLFFFLNYALAYQPTFLPGEFLGFLGTLAPYRAVQYPLVTRLNLLFLMVYTVLFGSGLIAKDRSSGALPLYLSRPLTLTDYVLGKFGVIAWFVAAFTLVPNLVLWLFAVASDPGEHALRDALPQLLPIFAHNGTVIALYSLTILAVSSLCRRPMFAGLIWFTLVILLPNFTAFLAAQLNMVGLAAISPNDAIAAIGYDLFDLGTLYESALGLAETDRDARDGVEAVFAVVNAYSKTPPDLAWASIGCWCLVSLGTLVSVLRRQDVVAEAGAR